LKGQVEEAYASVLADSDGPLKRILRRIFIIDFLPVAERLREQGEGKITNAFKQRSTEWADHENFSPSSFEVPSVLDAAVCDIPEMVGAITRFWTPCKATDVLRPVLSRLLHLTRQYSDKDESPEPVHDSIYVMY